MKLHSLQMHAFGPFAADAEVDFDALGVDGLFLLHGQTGAGKTTVLDAVAFALFGRVPGARDDGRRLLSDHAKPGDSPSVTLEATIGGRRLRVTRSPEHHRTKKRGTGLTRVNAAGTLTWVDGSGPNLARLPEIGEVITRILGMTADQFFQVVLLPQGEFARFLRASTDDRERLLERLFETERFNDLEGWLRERARTSRTELEDKGQAVDRLAGQIAVVADTTQPVEPDFDWAQQLLDSVRAEVVAAADHVGTTREAARSADRAHTEARYVHELHRRGRTAQAQLAALDAERTTIASAHSMVDAARRAEPVRAVAAEHERAQQECARVTSVREKAHARLTATDDGAALAHRLSWPAAPTDRAAIEDAMEQWTAEAGRLEPLERRIGERPALVRSIDDTTASRVRADEQIVSVDEALASAPRRRAESEKALAAAVAASARLPQLRTAAEAAEVARTAHARLEHLDADVERARTQLASHRDRHQLARERVLDLRERRIAGMAAELSAGLRDGDRCVVCGATEHPAPAVTEAEHVREQDEADARAEERACETDRSAAERALAAIETDRALWRERTGGVTRDEATAEVDRIVGERRRVSQEAHAEATVRADLTAHDADTERLRADRAALQTLVAELRERGAHLTRRLADLDAETASATDGTTTVAARRRALADACAALTQVREARSACTAADDRVRECTARLDVALAETGFESVTAARAALLTPAEIAGFEKQVRQAADIRAAAQATVDDPEVARVIGTDRPDLDRLEADRIAADTAATSAATRHASAVATAAKLEHLCADFWSAVSVLAPAAARDAELQGLAELVAGRGQNSRRMSLRSYVLAARLEEVILAASFRLRQMSSGRYEFAHSDAAASRGRRSGLGIEIRDEYTGAVRPANTLSGGETFFASLALALGLADVVSAESGGRVLDTIFIDEGFGTLDPEALDLVMGVLDELRSGGRVVGVVSHVDEMRARIPAQLRVIRGEGGSALQMIGTSGQRFG
ncbi:AAA family ATPase [Williamsia phyllosphaerae]|uniref:Nuclease SbcCD subunit C n=1 Tax=Williamsia phyllosphaerae TaxID=885042 RepID=A0ABQ1UZ90_9NOCA|nr:SMC family ATPase [Williamsia phyllosphaerae]GGF30861.1 nuclease SbcCD subunit C [Williamsia phyllosphaerae]